MRFPAGMELSVSVSSGGLCCFQLVYFNCRRPATCDYTPAGNLKKIYSDCRTKKDYF